MAPSSPGSWEDVAWLLEEEELFEELEDELDEELEEELEDELCWDPPLFQV